MFPILFSVRWMFLQGAGVSLLGTIASLANLSVKTNHLGRGGEGLGLINSNLRLSSVECLNRASHIFGLLYLFCESDGLLALIKVLSIMMRK